MIAPQDASGLAARKASKAPMMVTGGVLLYTIPTAKLENFLGSPGTLYRDDNFRLG